MNNRKVVPTSILLLLFISATSLLATYDFTDLAQPLVRDIAGAEWEREVVNSTLPVWVEFYKKNNAVCKEQLHTLTKVARRYRGRMKFVSMCADSNKDALELLNVPNRPDYLPFHRIYPFRRALPAGLTPLEAKAELEKQEESFSQRFLFSEDIVISVIDQMLARRKKPSSLEE